MTHLTLDSYEVELPLRHTFEIAHGKHDTQRSLIVALGDGEHTGYGEGSAVSYYGMPAAEMRRAVERVRATVIATELREPAAWHATLAPLLEDNPFALCALDQAAHDLWGKRLGQPTWQLWGLDRSTVPASDYTIGIADIPTMERKLDEEPGWPIYKIKLGRPDDLDILAALRARTDAVFRVDANCGWTAEQTIANSHRLAELGVEFIEQPLPVEDLDGARRVFAESALPIVADESCQVEADVERCADHFHGVNIKLTKCGGLTPARRMVRRARQLGLRVMLGCMVESTVGISAIGQILPELDDVDMDGAVLLGADLADGVRVDRGIAHYPDTPGNGVTLRPDFERFLIAHN